MNEQVPEGQALAPGMLTPPPWPSFGARPAEAVAAHDSAAHDSAADDSAADHSAADDSAADVPDSARDDDASPQDADLETGGLADVVIFLASATSRPSVRPDDATVIPASANDADLDNVAVAPLIESSGPSTDQAPGRIAATLASSGLRSAGSAVKLLGPVAGTAPAAPEGLERWRSIQSAFVDDPRGSVTAAADLAARVVGTLVASVKERERELRDEWDRDDVDTEGLRNALLQYRSFVEHLPAL